MKARKIRVLLGLGLFMSGALLCAADGKTKWWVKSTAKPGGAKEVKKKINVSALKKHLENAYKSLAQVQTLDLPEQNNILTIYLAIAREVFDKQTNNPNFGKNYRILQAVDFIRDNTANNNVLRRIDVHLRKFLDQLLAQVLVVNNLMQASVTPLAADKALDLWTEYQWLIGDVQKVKQEEFSFGSKQKVARDMFLKLMPVITVVVKKLHIEQLALQEVRGISNKNAVKTAQGEEEKLKNAAEVKARLEALWATIEAPYYEQKKELDEAWQQLSWKKNKDENTQKADYYRQKSDYDRQLRSDSKAIMKQIFAEASQKVEHGADQREVEAYLNFLLSKSYYMDDMELEADTEVLWRRFEKAQGVKLHRIKRV